MPAGDSKAQVLIELQLEMKKLKAQLKEVSSTLKKFRREVETLSKAQEKSSAEQVKGLKKAESAQAKAAKEWENSENKKIKATKKATEQIRAQEKELGKLGKAIDKLKQSSIGKFAGGFAAGAGLAGVGRGMGTPGGFGGTIGRFGSRVAGAAIGFGISGITQAYQQYAQYGLAQAGLIGLGTPGQLGAGRSAAKYRGLGYGPTETMLQARSVGRATGNIGAVYRAQQFGRAYGMDVGEAGGYMGMLRQAGFGFGGMVRGPGGKMQATRREGSRELTKIIEAGMISGLEKGRIGEFLQGVSSITSQLGSQLPGKINVSGIAAQAAMLGQSKLPGFQGARGMQLLARLNQSIQRPGGGEAGQAMMLQALGFGKPGGGTRYYEALKMQEQGINDPRNLPKLMKEVYSQLGDPSKGGRSMVNEEANLAMKEITGLSLKQIEELQDLMVSGKSSEEIQTRIEEQMKEAKSIEEQALEAMSKGFSKVAGHVASSESKQVSIGRKHSDFFMKMQNLQLKALKILSDHLPDMAKLLEMLVTEIKILVENFARWMGRGDMSKEIKALREKSDKEVQEFLGRKYKSVKERQEATRAAARKRQETLNKLETEYTDKLGEARSKGIVGTAISMFGGDEDKIKNLRKQRDEARAAMEKQRREEERVAKLVKSNIENIPGYDPHAKTGRKAAEFQRRLSLHYRGIKDFPAKERLAAEAGILSEQQELMVGKRRSSPSTTGRNRVDVVSRTERSGVPGR